MKNLFFLAYFIPALAFGLIRNPDIATNANITLSKLAALTANTACVLDASGYLTSSSTTDVQIGYLNTLTSNVQTQIDSKQVAGNYITALTSDVSASGPGSVAATVNSVGGSSAANVHSAELLANAATNLNTASAIVKRDGSGNFSAGTITAALTGTASGNLTLASPVNHGVLISGSANATTATAAGATNTLLHGNTGADPTYSDIVNADIDAAAAIVDTKLATISTAGKVSNSATTAASANTPSAIVARDGSGNFTAGTITAALTGTASGNPPNARAINTTAPITGGGDLSADRTLACNVASGSQAGCLSSADWTTFNGKQAAGNYITDLTGDVAASGPGSAAATLATVNANTGSFGSSTSIPNFTVNGKGLITAAGGNAVIAPAGTLTGTTLNSTVVSSSLTSVGTIGTGVWNGTLIGTGFGGTGTSTTFTQGSSIFAGASGVYSQDNANYFWDATNHRLGLGITAPTSRLHQDNGTGTATSHQFTAGSTTGQTASDGTLIGLDSSGDTIINQQEALPMIFSTSGSEAMRLDSSQNFMVGRTATVSGALMRVGKTIADPASNTFATVYDGAFNATSADNSNTIAGVSFNMSIGTNNSKNWTSGNGVEAIRITPTIASGATGTVSNFYGMFQTFANSSAMNVTNLFGNRINNPTNTGGGTITNAVGYSTAEINSATNNTELLLGTNNAPTGNFGIYDVSAYNNYFATNSGFGLTDPGSPVAAAAGGVTVNSSEQYEARSNRAAIVAGNLIGGVRYRSNDTSLTAPGTVVALEDAVAEATHTSSDLTTGMAFYTTATLTTAERMRIAGSGKVGIGLTAPTNLLHLDGGSATATYLQLTENATTGQNATDGLLVGTDASANGIINQQENLPLKIYTNAVETAELGANQDITFLGNGFLTNTPRFEFKHDGNRNEYLGSASSDNVYTQNAITQDTPSSAATGTPANSLTWSHTVGTGSNRILIVGVSSAAQGANITVTYGGVSMTAVPSSLATAITLAQSQLFYLLNPTSGAANIVVSTSGTVDRIVGGGVSLANVNQTNPLGTAKITSGNSTSASLSVPSNVGDVVIDVLAKNNTDVPTAGGSQASKWNATSGGVDLPTAKELGAGSTLAGSDATTAMSWSWTNARAFAYSSVAVKPTYSVSQTITSTGHIEQSGTTPAVGTGAADCGTSPSIVGNDNEGRVTVGTSPGSKCTVTFANSWTNAPICNTSNEVSANLLRPASVTTTKVELTGTLTVGDTLVYRCVGYK
jgi:hypothetical protein